MALFVPKTTGYVARRGVRDFSIGATSLDDGIHDGSYANVVGDHSPRCTTGIDSTTGASAWGPPTGVTGDINQVVFQGSVGMVPADHEVIVTQTILGPVRHALGINVSQDATNADGVQYAFGGGNRGTIGAAAPLFTRNRFQHLVGTTGDSFIKGTLFVEDADGATFFIGWRKQELFVALHDDYNDLTGIGGTAGAVKVAEIQTNAATVTSASLGTLADTTAYNFEVRVSKAGRATYFWNLATATTPTQVNPGTTYTYTSGLTLIPYLHFLQTANVTELYIQNLQIGRRRSIDADRSSQD